MTVKRLYLALLVFLSMMLTSCPSPILDNRSPVIVSISTGGATATIGETKAISAMASDPDGDTIQYSWDATGGSFSATTGQNVNWTAPDSAGIVSITLSISDGQNATVSKSVNLTVTIPNTPASSFVAESRPQAALLSWINPETSNFASVLIRRSDSSYPLEPTEGTEVYRGSNQSFLDTGLEEGTQYYYSAWAINNSNAYSTRVTATATPTIVDTTAPFDVTNLRATAGDSMISLAWDPPFNDDFDYAEISFTPVQFGIPQPIKTSRGVNGYNIAGLTNTVEYSFLVRSVDTSGNRSLGTTITGRPAGTINQDDRTPPSNVVSLQTTQGENEISLSWVTPVEPDYAYAEISFTPTQAGVAQPIVIPRGSLSTTIRPLRGGQVFTFTVKSVDFSGNKSAGIAASDLVLDSTAPGNPQSLRFTSTGNGTGTLTWSNPMDFDYKTSNLSCDLPITGFPTGVTGTTKSLTGLVGIPYTVTVRSEDYSGNQSTGTVVTFTPLDTTAPASLANTSATSAVVNSTGSTIDLWWNTPTELDFNHIEITFNPEAAGVEQPLRIPKGTNTASVGSLANGTYYTFTLRVVDAAGNKSSSILRGATPADGPPANVNMLTATPGLDGGRVSFSWTTPADSDFSHVELLFSPGIAGVAQPIVLPKTTTSYTRNGLTNGTYYSFVFKSVDLNGNRSNGVTVNATPSNPPPGRIPGVWFTPEPAGSALTINWTEPASADYTHVKLSFTPEVVGLTQPVRVEKGTTSTKLTGLENGVLYTFSMVACDATEAADSPVSWSAIPWDSRDGSYVVGSVGPAGGIVFHDAGNSDMGWRYMEAWTVDEGSYKWKTTYTTTSGTATAIGSGSTNTLFMSGIDHPAAQACLNAEHGGYTDWFLPSKDELNLLFVQRVAIGGFSYTNYWSSSEKDSSYAWAQYSSSSATAVEKTSNYTRVRAIRAF